MAVSVFAGGGSGPGGEVNPGFAGCREGEAEYCENAEVRNQMNANVQDGGKLSCVTGAAGQ